MKRLSLSQAKANIGQLARRASKGETIVLLDRSRPIAKIVRLEHSEVDDSDLLNGLVGRGVIAPPTRTLRRSLFQGPAVRSNRSVLEALLDERSDEDR